MVVKYRRIQIPLFVAIPWNAAVELEIVQRRAFTEGETFGDAGSDSQEER